MFLNAYSRDEQGPVSDYRNVQVCRPHPSRVHPGVTCDETSCPLSGPPRTNKGQVDYKLTT